MGLSPTVYLSAGHAAEIEALDHDWSVPIERTRGPPDRINARALNASVVTVVMRSGGEHRDRWIAIQRQQIEAFV